MRKSKLMEYGFLPARGSMMLDFVVVAMVGVVILLLASVFLARYRREFRWHRTIQISLASVLFVVIILFEVDLRMFTDWRSNAAKSPYYSSGWVDRMLIVHLLFAVPTFFLWAVTIGLALRKMGSNFGNLDHRRVHRILGWTGTVTMVMTAVTGWIFYWMSFVAS